MNNLRNMFLGTAAVFLAASSGAQAADMMMDTKAPREPVYRCDITGFIELPGTDICFKVGGYAKFVAYMTEDTNPGVGAWSITPGGQSLDDTFQMYSVGRVNFDARTATEYGTVRAFIEMQATDNDTNTGGSFNMRHAFVQFGNWTFGKTWSTFLHLDSSPAYANPYTVVGDNFVRRNQIRYTAGFGNGFSLSIAVEDQEFMDPDSAVATGFAAPWWTYCGGACSVANDRNEAPDVVANIRVDGDWGNAQLSGALTNNQFRDVYNGTASAPVVGQQTDSEFGWAALFGMVVNTPATGDGDYFGFKAIYTDGASQYLGGGEYSGYNFGSPTNVVWGACSYTLISQGDCILDTVTTWSVLASFTHNWSPTVASTFGGGYQNWEQPYTRLTSAAYPYADSMEVDVWEIFGNVTWTPVPRTSFMIDVHYQSIDFNGANGASAYSPAGLVTAAPLSDSLFDQDEGAFTAAFEVTRTF